MRAECRPYQTAKRKIKATNKAHHFQPRPPHPAAYSRTPSASLLLWPQTQQVSTVSVKTQTGNLFPPLNSSRKWTPTEHYPIGWKALGMSNHWVICLGSGWRFAELAGTVCNRLWVFGSSIWLAEVAHCVNRRSDVFIRSWPFKTSGAVVSKWGTALCNRVGLQVNLPLSLSILGMQSFWTPSTKKLLTCSLVS